MPTPVKPCIGRFSESTVETLRANVGRAQWLPQPCEQCGQVVGARLEKGLWVPEPHWPSVPRRPSTRTPVVESDAKASELQDTAEPMANDRDK
jgi:hypothetical protein